MAAAVLAGIEQEPATAAGRALKARFLGGAQALPSDEPATAAGRALKEKYLGQGGEPATEAGRALKARFAPSAPVQAPYEERPATGVTADAAYGQPPGRSQAQARLAGPARMGYSVTIDQIRETAKRDPEVANVLQHFENEQRGHNERRGQLEDQALQATLADQRPEPQRSPDELALRQALRGTGRRDEPLTQQVGPTAPSLALAPAAQQAHLAAREIANQQGGSRVSNDLVAERVLNYFAEKSAMSQDEFRKANPWLEATLSQGVGQIPSIVTAELASSGLGKFVRAGAPAVKYVKPLVQKLARAGTFASTMQAQRIAGGAQAEFEPLQAAEDAALMVAGGKFGKWLGGTRVGRMAGEAGAKALESGAAVTAMSVPGIARGAYGRITGDKDYQEFGWKQAALQAYAGLLQGAVAAGVSGPSRFIGEPGRPRPVAPADRTFSGPLGEAYAEGGRRSAARSGQETTPIPDAAQERFTRPPIERVLLEKLTSQEPVAFTPDEMVRLGALHAEGKLSAEALDLLTRPPSQQPAPRDAIGERLQAAREASVGEWDAGIRREQAAGEARAAIRPGRAPGGIGSIPPERTAFLRGATYRGITPERVEALAASRRVQTPDMPFRRLSAVEGRLREASAALEVRGPTTAADQRRTAPPKVTPSAGEDAGRRPFFEEMKRKGAERLRSPPKRGTSPAVSPERGRPTTPRKSVFQQIKEHQFDNSEAAKASRRRVLDLMDHERVASKALHDAFGDDKADWLQEAVRVKDQADRPGSAAHRDLVRSILADATDTQKSALAEYMRARSARFAAYDILLEASDATPIEARDVSRPTPKRGTSGSLRNPVEWISHLLLDMEQVNRDRPRDRARDEIRPVAPGPEAPRTPKEMAAHIAQRNRNLAASSLFESITRKGPLGKLGSRTKDFLFGTRTAPDVKAAEDASRAKFGGPKLDWHFAAAYFDAALRKAAKETGLPRDTLEEVAFYDTQGQEHPRANEVPQKVREGIFDLAAGLVEHARSTGEFAAAEDLMAEAVYHKPDYKKTRGVLLKDAKEAKKLTRKAKTPADRAAAKSLLKDTYAKIKANEGVFYQSDFDAGLVDRQNPPGELVAGRAFYAAHGYWPFLSRKQGTIKRMLRGAGKSDIGTLHGADNRYKQRTNDFAQHVARGGETRLSKGFPEITAEMAAAEIAYKLRVLAEADSGAIRDKGEMPDADTRADAATEVTRLREHLGTDLRTELREANQAFKVAGNNSRDKAAAFELVMEAHNKITETQMAIQAAQHMASPDGYVELGKEWGAQEGKFMRRDAYDYFKAQQEYGHAIPKVIRGVMSAMAGHVTYERVLGHFARDFLSNVVGMDQGGVNPLSPAGLGVIRESAGFVIGYLKGEQPTDPGFRAWLAELVVGGDLVSGAGQFNQKDVGRVEAMLADADAAAARGESFSSMANRFGAITVGIGELANKIPVLNFGKKYGRLSDLITAAAYYRMLTQNKGSRYGYRMPHGEAMALHDARFSMSEMAPGLRSLGKWVQFLSYPLKEAGSTIEYAAKNPRSIPLLDRPIQRSPTGASAQAAVSGRMALNIIGNAAKRVGPVFLLGLLQRKRLGITDDEWNSELDRDLQWMPAPLRGIVKAMAVPYWRNEDGSFHYLDLSDFAPGTPIMKYMAMPLAALGSTSRQNMADWLLRKNMFTSAVTTVATGVNSFGSPVDGWERAYLPLQQLLPGSVSEVVSGAVKLRRAYKNDGLHGALDVVRATGTAQGGVTPGRQPYGDAVLEADKAGKFDWVRNMSTGKKWLQPNDSASRLDARRLERFYDSIKRKKRLREYREAAAGAMGRE